MKANVEIGGGQTLELKGAVLVYSAMGRAFCTWHESQRTESGAAQLGAATALTSDFVCSLASELRQRVRIEVFSDRVLARAEDTMVWWTPATVRPMFFRSTADDLGELSGKRFPQPSLVWRVQGRDLCVRALAQNLRPAADSMLCVAPYLNTDGKDGSVCQGSMRSPDEVGIEALPLWEQAFFQSEFTHQIGNRKLTSHAGGFDGLWRSLAGKARFPAKFLIPASETLLEFAQREH